MRASFDFRLRDPAPVGIYPEGVTPEEIFDLAGNVWEWCQDWFGDYPAEEQRDPTGPDEGKSRVLRGGSFVNSSGVPARRLPLRRSSGGPGRRLRFSLGVVVASRTGLSLTLGCPRCARADDLFGLGSLEVLPFGPVARLQRRACCAGARSTTIRGTCAAPTATTIIQRTGTTTSVFAWCGRRVQHWENGLGPSARIPASRAANRRERALSSPAGSPGRGLGRGRRRRPADALVAPANARRRAATFSDRGGVVDLQLLPAAQKAYDLNRWLLPRLERFSRRYRFTLGDRLQATALDLCLALVEASHSRTKERPLYRANRLLDQLRVLLRLAADLGELTVRQLEFASHLNAELGRMIGGWQKASRAPPHSRTSQARLSVE